MSTYRAYRPPVAAAMSAVAVIVALHTAATVPEAQGVNLIINGSFEQPMISGGFQVFSSIPGWEAAPESPGFELQRGAAGDSFDGDQHCELDAFAPATIFQDVPTEAGRVYELSFAFSARPGTSLPDNVLRVNWGGEDVTTLAESGEGLTNTSWKVHRFQVLGGPGTTTRLRLQDLGVSNTLGTYIDDVRVIDMGFSVTSSLPRHLQLGTPVLLTMAAAGGQAPYAWSLTAGSLPTGLVLAVNGTLSGVPPVLGKFTLTLQAFDITGQRTEKNFMIEVVLVPPPPDVRVYKVGTVAVPGRTVDYFAVVQNVGDVVAENIRIREFVEPWFTVVAASPTPTRVIQGPDIFPNTNALDTSYDMFVDWQLRLDPGQALVVTYRVELDSRVPLGTTVAGPVCLTPEEADACGGDLLTVYIDALNACAVFILRGTPQLCPAYPFGASLVYFQCMADRAFDCGRHEEPTRGAVDPNEKLVISQRFIQPDQLLIYPIHFENIGDIEARDVFITDVLDPNLDLNTVQILTSGATLDPTTRVLRWELLNRNLNPGETDNVLFSVKPAAGLPSGTEIRNKAEIQFEIFAPLITPEVVNIIDSSPPQCVVNTLPGQVFSDDFRISWRGSDPVGEIESYTIFVQKNGGNFLKFIESSATDATFQGENGATYGFFCVAKDTAGNIEDQPLGAEATTTIVPPVETVQISIKPGSGVPTPVNPKSRGVIPVAILSTPSFDAASVNPASVRFGATGTETAARRNAMEDVDGDGDRDMVLHFPSESTAIICGSRKAFLTGMTVGGRSLAGSASVRTVGCNLADFLAGR